MRGGAEESWGAFIGGRGGGEAWRERIGEFGAKKMAVKGSLEWTWREG
jgi:hypothetical protein